MDKQPKLLAALLKSFLAVLFLLSFSCGKLKKSARQRDARNLTDAAYKPGLHLKSGDRYYYAVSSETKTDFEVNNQDVENLNRSQAGLSYEVLKDTAGGFLLKMTYDRLHVFLKTMGSEKEMDADGGLNSIDPVEKMMARLKGTSLLIVVNSGGHVVSVNGYQELSDKIMSGVAIPTEQDRKKMQAELSQMFGDGFVKNNMEQGFSLLPDTAVYVGDSWTKKLSPVNVVQLTMQSKYTLAAVDNNVAEIDAGSDITDKDSNVDMMGYKVDVDLKGHETGTYQQDMLTGLLRKGSSSLSLKGSLQMMAKEVPLTIKVKKEVTLTRI